MLHSSQFIVVTITPVIILVIMLRSAQFIVVTITPVIILVIMHISYDGHDTFETRIVEAKLWCISTKRVFDYLYSG